MKLFSLSLFFTVMWAMSLAQIKSDVQRLALKGRVKTLEESEYTSKKKLINKFKYTFDNSGNIIKLTTEEGVGEKYRITKYKYDSKGNIEERTDSGSRGLRNYKLEGKPTPKGFTLQTDIFYNNRKEREARIISRFDTNYNEQYHTEYDKNGGVIIDKTCNYDQKNNLVQETWYDSEGISYNQLTYRYDNDGNPVKFKVYSMKPTIKEQRDFLMKSEIRTYGV